MHHDHTATHRLTVTGIDPSGATHTATATWYAPDPQPAELPRTSRPQGRAKAVQPSGYYVLTLQTDSGELHRLQLHGSQTHALQTLMQHDLEAMPAINAHAARVATAAPSTCTVAAPHPSRLSALWAWLTTDAFGGNHPHQPQF